MVRPETRNKRLVLRSVRLGVSCQLFLAFVVGRATRTELIVVEAQNVVQAVSARYSSGFVLPSLAMRQSRRGGPQHARAPRSCALCGSKA